MWYILGTMLYKEIHQWAKTDRAPAFMMFMVWHYFNNWKKAIFILPWPIDTSQDLTVEPVPDQEDITYDLYKAMKYSNMFFQEYQQ